MSQVLVLILLILYKIVSMSFESAIVIILTALTAFLAALAIVIGVFAIFGYVSIKEGVTLATEKKVTMAMDLKMKAYPDPVEMAELKERMEFAIGSWEQMRNQIVTDTAPKEVAAASNIGVQQETKVAPQYPGQEVQNVGSTPANPAAPASPSATKPDADTH